MDESNKVLVWKEVYHCLRDRKWEDVVDEFVKVNGRCMVVDHRSMLDWEGHCE